MKIDIPSELIPKLLRQLRGLNEQGEDNEWCRTALGIFYGLLIQETKGGKVPKSISQAAKKNRRMFRNSFRRK